MTTAKEEVLRLVFSGKVTSAEGDELLRAMSAPRRRWPLRLLINPFERLGGVTALAIGLFGSLAGIALSRLHVRFDGALDVHVVPLAPPLREAVLDQLVAWPLVAAVAWLIGLTIAPKGRMVDFLGVVGVARIPLLLVGVFAAAARHRLPMDPAGIGSTPPAVLLGLVAVILPAIAWMLVLLIEGFRTATGVLGPKGGVAFVGVVVVAEIASKVALSIAS